MMGSFCSGGSASTRCSLSASTRCSFSDGTLESSGDEHQQAERERQWWKCMGAADVEGAADWGAGPCANDKVGAHGQEVASAATWVTAQDLEVRMNASSSSLRHGASDTRLLIGACYSSKATGAIARRVAKACQKHVSWQ